MIALIIFPQRFLYSVAVAGATVAILASVVTLLAVPALLSLLGERINSLSIRSGSAVSDTSDGWYRLAWAVMRRPVTIALATTAFLLAARRSASLHDPHRPERARRCLPLSRRTS